MKSYFIFLSRHKLYTFINLFGFSISLMFVLLLGRYVQQQLSVDNFQANKHRTYLYAIETASQGVVTATSNAGADYIKERVPEVESYVRVLHRPVDARVDGQERVRYKALFADSTFFHIFSFPLYQGNAGTVLSTPYSAVLTRSCARRIFGSDDPMGKMLEIDDQRVTVTGVMNDWPSNTQLGKADMVLSYHMIEHYWSNNILSDWNNSSFNCYFMAKEGTSLIGKGEMVKQSFLDNNYWLFGSGFASEVLFIPLKDVYFYGLKAYGMDLHTNSKTQVMVFLGIAVLILVVALLNYINLSVSQAGFRGKEAATRKLLGCPRHRLIAKLLGESVMMTSVAFAIAVLLALLAEPFFDQALSTQLALEGLLAPAPILLVVASIATIGLVAGLAPALVISHFDPLEIVKGSLARKIKSTYSKVLITFQYTVAIALLICSAFMLLQSRFMRNHDLGYAHNNILVLQNVMGQNSAAGVKDRFKSIAGVEQVSFVNGSPLQGISNNLSFSHNGEALSFETFVVDSAFFDIFNIKVEPTGVAPSPDNRLLNPTAMATLQPDTNSYRVQIHEGWSIQVAGVTNAFHFRPLQMAIGCAMIQVDNNNNHPWSIIVKLNPAANLLQTAEAVRSEYFAYNGQRPFDMQFSEDIIAQQYTQETNTSKIIGAFTLLTIVILVMGIFAMSLYFIKQKEREIAVRKVNGATELQLVEMLNRLFVGNIAIAFALAIPISYIAMHQWLQGFAYRIPLHWWVFVLAGVGIVLLSALTISGQVYKAATANPASTLKKG